MHNFLMDKIRNFKQTFATCKFCYQYTSDVFIIFFFLQQISPKKIRIVMSIMLVQMMKGPMKCSIERGFKSEYSMTGGGEKRSDSALASKPTW